MGPGTSATASLDGQPRARRPIAGAFRTTAATAVDFCIVSRIHPDSISLSSIAISALAAICFAKAAQMPWLLIVAPVFCYLRLWLNMLDGMVAIASQQASRRGEILNDFPDRVSDVLIFAGVAHSGLASPLSAYWAAIFALLTAYVGILGQAVGAHREFSGLMSKPWRMVALHIGATVSLVLPWPGGQSGIEGLTPLDWTCVLIVSGCVQTIALRLKRIIRAIETADRRLTDIDEQERLK